MRAAVAVTTLAAVLALAPGHAANAAPSRLPQFVTIAPGSQSLLNAANRINVVFVGYQPSSVDVPRLLGQLPQNSALPLVRAPAFDGIFEGPALTYSYAYNVRFAGHTFENDFFGYLSRAGQVGAPDFYQSYYNSQVHKNLTVGPTVRYIDARATESWLEQHASGELGIDPGEYTVFLVNWYGRSDFQFHTYTNLGRPDPDTGRDVNAQYSSTHVRAWGGSSGPTWFYDLSAGPVWIDHSFDVDDTDVNGFGLNDYRVPSIWDYGHTGYRAFNDLTHDLGLVLRYVAVDMLFAASPIFDPGATLPAPDGGKQIALDIFEGDPSTNGLADIHPDVLRAAHQYLEPYYPISVSVRDLPLSGDALTAYNLATYATTGPGCWNTIGVQAAEFYCYFYRDNFSTYFPQPGPNSVIPAVGFTAADNPAARVEFQGETEDDWQTGKPSLIEGFDTVQNRTGVYGMGYTDLIMHEAGHYVGLSHPHDGLDINGHYYLDFGPFGDFDFARTGDETASIMSYLPGNQAFDVFNRDNLAKWTVGELRYFGNQAAATILAATPNPVALALLHKADGEYTAALAAWQTEQWVTAATFAAKAYRDVQRSMLAAGLGSATAANTRMQAATDGAPVAAAGVGAPAAIRVDAPVSMTRPKVAGPRGPIDAVTQDLSDAPDASK
jgi:hypothetical protein